MASKKFLMLLVAILSLSMSMFSQVKIGTTYDSTYVPSGRMSQHNEFMAGEYNFPAKPRNMWEIGVKGGLMNISGDMPAQITPVSWGVHIRKAIGYVFSLRAEYMNAVGRGRSFKPTTDYINNTAWRGAGYTTGTDIIYMNYKTKLQDLSLQGVVTLNNIRFHKAKTGVVLYGFGGIGATVFETHVNAKDGNGAKVNMNGIPSGSHKERKKTYDLIETAYGGDDTYETPAENQGNRVPVFNDKTLRPSATAGIGLAFRLGRAVNLAIESRQTFVKDDLLDGQQWQGSDETAMTRDFDSYNFSSIGLNINLGAKAVEPLWWNNPLDYAYDEIRNPRLMRIPPPVLLDGDSDGVMDQFDREVTPEGCPVDSHGVSQDTDGDGVPDCKDKQLITPTYCFPVDADGVGNCKINCDDVKGCIPAGPIEGASDCSVLLSALPSISFKANSNALSADAKAVLSAIAATLKANASCRIAVVGYCNSTKKEQQLSWDHVNKVINYFVENEGLSQDRFVFTYGQGGGDCNTVDFRAAAAGDVGPAIVAPPHPHLQKKN